ncbi:MAG: L-histidine N(alpha)-methyltransferase [Gammaproteobacteria bacterium]|nr:L-histidine N(alpha)-methyltransferase [Gammaproteobacteria bacterium]
MNDETPTLDDQSPARREELAQLRAGLNEKRKWISSMYFYDEKGSELFERITTLPEYYLTRTEVAIMQAFADDMAACIGSSATVIEPGSGAGEKIGLLLRALDEPVAYVPIEIARGHLEASAESLAQQFPAIEVLPVWADFTRPVEIPSPRRASKRRVVYFPGSTIGNFEPDDAVALLGNFADMVGPGGVALLGVDLAKSAAMLEPAYNDSAGVTAAFNLNMLDHLNRRFRTDFVRDNFEHLAFYNAGRWRIEMHLKSRCDQVVHVDGEAVHFEAGETIHTESSYKYDDKRFAALAEAGGFKLLRTWRDPDALFSLRYLAVE